MRDGKDHAAIAARIDKALNGEGRALTRYLLTPEQITGLEAFKRGVHAAKSAREAVPEWVTKLAKTGFEPQAVIDAAFGRSTPGGKLSSAELIKALKGTFGVDSPEFLALKQAAFQKLTMKPGGSTGDFEAQATTNRIATFLNGPGRSLATALYTADERAAIERFAAVTRMLTPKRVAGGSASPNSDTAPALASVLSKMGKHSSKIAALLGVGGFAAGGVQGGVAGFTAGRALETAGAKLTDKANRARALDAVAGAPRLPPPRPIAPAMPQSAPWAVGGGLLGGGVY